MQNKVVHAPHYQHIANRDRARTGTTLVEVLVVVTIITVLTVILFPVFASAREQGRRTTCLSNLRQISAALSTYTQDNDGYFPLQFAKASGFPGVKDWAATLAGNTATADVFRCPTAQVPKLWEDQVSAKGYAINGALYDHESRAEEPPALPLTTVRFPAITVAIAECAYRTGTTPGATSYPNSLTAPDESSRFVEADERFLGMAGALRHNGGSNYAFVDGHVHWYSPAQVSGAKQVTNGQQPTFAL